MGTAVRPIPNGRVTSPLALRTTSVRRFERCHRRLRKCPLRLSYLRHVTSQGSPLSRFRRAVSGTSTTNALAAAAELGSLDLDDALRLVLLLSEDREKTPAVGDDRPSRELQLLEEPAALVVREPHRL